MRSYTLNITCKACARKNRIVVNTSEPTTYACTECAERLHWSTGEVPAGFEPTRPPKCQGWAESDLEHAAHFGDVHGQTTLGRILDREVPLS